MARESAPAIMIDAFRERALALLFADPAPDAFDPNQIPEAGDHRLAAMLAPTDGRLHKPAAVLVPVIAHPDGATLLLTERAAHLKDHAGQIAFPGGKIDPSDQSPTAAALREAEEEIGLDRRHVEALGYLAPYLSSTGYRIIPIVAIIAPDARLAIDRNEVASVFEVPLGFLMDPARHEIHEREWRGVNRRYFAMPYGERYIWGVTAGIIRTLYERLYAP